MCGGVGGLNDDSEQMDGHSWGELNPISFYYTAPENVVKFGKSSLFATPVDIPSCQVIILALAKL